MCVEVEERGCTSDRESDLSDCQCLCRCLSLSSLGLRCERGWVSCSRSWYRTPHVSLSLFIFISPAAAAAASAPSLFTRTPSLSLSLCLIYTLQTIFFYHFSLSLDQSRCLPASLPVTSSSPPFSSSFFLARLTCTYTHADSQAHIRLMHDVWRRGDVDVCVFVELR